MKILIRNLRNWTGETVSRSHLNHHVKLLLLY